jgi:hypothetical protein
VEVDVVARGAKNPIPLALDYCPFCGTRISEGLRKHVPARVVKLKKS